MLLELDFGDNNIESVEIEDEAMAKFEAMAKERNMSLDALIALILKSACADAERGE